ncbi:Metallo-dependent phosphatase-like protein [Ilyonectria robusta]|uniref:Metallo-dependent phosphatase-like protein n=1 Tax=Ilyonectria robusta TaxID=1079257 RepID=UPI001E8E76A7|nr:Metallo-dependent phosphatase-like protein [Ilyonectria robusta]KAH8688280.1 Metallo-dependent phosphatase-like protein [Ilyonectria robusta]
MAREKEPTAEPQVTFASGRVDDGGSADSPPDVRIIHYNDVYHLDPSSAEPVGGLPRFITLCREYQEGKQYEGQPEALTLFSGDAFNPSLESSVTKGQHMVPVLNMIGTDCACVGNHDFDFGIKQYEHLAGQCDFPWLLANVLDPALGEDVPMGNAKKTHMMTTSNGIKVGFIGLGEREWLETINSLPPNLIYKSATATAKEIVPQLREQGAEIIICLSHMREPNDNKLAQQTEGIIDIILGGHDHYYAHSFINGTHALRSGTDFKNLSYIEARRKPDDPKRWDFDIWRRDVTSSIAEDEPTQRLVGELTSKLNQSLAKPVGWTATPLDARFSTVRLKESNIGNFVCDVMRQHHHADCTIMAAGTIRADQIYPPGAIRIKDITTCFPFEDPVVLLRVTGQAIWDALENGVSQYPALEGRFPQVSNIRFEFDPKLPRGQRILSMEIGGVTYDPEKKYVLATRGYMGRGKDGFTSLLVKSEGGEAEEIIEEENGILISAMLRQYFMALRTVGQWKHLSDHWVNVVENCETPISPIREGAYGFPSMDNLAAYLPVPDRAKVTEDSADPWSKFLKRRFMVNAKPVHENVDSEVDEDDDSDEDARDGGDQLDFEILLMRKFWTRWALKTGVKSSICDPLKEGAFSVDWTRCIAPVVDGRIKMVES